MSTCRPSWTCHVWLNALVYVYIYNVYIYICIFILEPTIRCLGPKWRSCYWLRKITTDDELWSFQAIPKQQSYLGSVLGTIQPAQYQDFSCWYGLIRNCWQSRHCYGMSIYCNLFGSLSLSGTSFASKHQKRNMGRGG